MMQLVRRLAIAAAMLSLGCTEAIGPRDSFPAFIGIWAGERWTASANAYLATGGAAGDTLYVYASNPPNSGVMVRETLTARIIVHGTGAYPLGPSAVRFDELVGGDVISASYVTTRSSTGTLTLLSYDGVGRVAEGRIEFDAESNSPYGSYGRMASMRDAFFSVVVKARPRY